MEKIFSVLGYHSFWVLKSSPLCTLFLSPQENSDCIDKNKIALHQHQGIKHGAGGRWKISKGRMMVNLY